MAISPTPRKEEGDIIRGGSLYVHAIVEATLTRSIACHEVSIELLL
jgi:hypothetical protein